MSWQQVEKTEPIVAGITYRSTYFFTCPYNDTLASSLVRAIIGARNAMKIVGVWIDSATSSSPELVTQVPSSRYKRWAVSVKWRKL